LILVKKYYFTKKFSYLMNIITLKNIAFEKFTSGLILQPWFILTNRTFLGVTLILSFCSNCGLEQNINSIEKIHDGKIDLTQHDFAQKSILKLYGKFKFYHGKLSSEIHEASYWELLEVPKSWTSLGYSPFGYATYELTVKLPLQKEKLVLFILDAATSFRVVWNGKVLEDVGRVAKEKSNYIPSYKTSIIPLEEYAQNNRLLIEVANFEHHKAGLWEAIYIGKYDALQRKILLKNYLLFFIIGACFILGLYHLGVYRFKKKESLELFFSFLCFAFSFQNLFFNPSLIYTLLPELDWESSVRLNYFFSYLPGIFFVLFYERLFPNTFSTLFFRVYIFLFLMMLLGVLILPIFYFTQTLPFSFVLNLICFTYIFVKLLLSKHTRNFQYYLTLLALGTLILTLLVDAFSLQQYVPISSVSAFGILLFVYTHAYILSIRFSKALFTVENLVQRLRRSNEKLRNLKSELEAIIEKRTQELIRERTRAELIGRMTTEIVHDLKNPISAIIGFSGLANTDTIGRKARQEYLEIIQAESIKLADLSQGILDYVKGGAVIQKERVNLKSYFDNINKLLINEFKIVNIEYFTINMLKF
ncbi:MAG: hypothetical protein N3A69_12090, partial [Leptospiraceae bacterium]|nr:hypothetical protein [Leptospiraceae bacterium]